MTYRKKVIELRLEPYELLSFLVFPTLIVGAMILQSAFVYLYLALLILDFFGTLLNLGAVILIERSFFAVFFVLAGAFAEGYSAFESVLSIIAIIVILDFTFLLRRIQDTKIFTSSTIVKRLKTYVSSAGSAIFVSYLFIFLYSEISPIAPYAIPLFGVAAVCAFLLLITIIRTFKNTASNPVS